MLLIYLLCTVIPLLLLLICILKEAEEDVNSPIKQHPMPFDEAMDREKSMEFIKCGRQLQTLGGHWTPNS